MSYGFLFPELNRRLLVRGALVAVLAYLFFGHVCIPMWIHGKSMEPTCQDGTFTFCWCPRFWFREPRIGDIVVVRMAGTRVMLLKRVVAVTGDTVEFRHGTLFVNGRARQEAYVRTPCDWELPPRLVKPGNLYVVGDNRGVPLEAHLFGQTERTRINGGPLW